MLQVLFVCSGNTCRSPVAAALLRERLKKTAYLNWVIGSAGVHANIGENAAQFSIELMTERGIDLSMHRSHVLDFKDVIASNLILCLSQNHVSEVCSQYPDHCEKVYKLSEMIGENFDIADPFGGSYEDYSKMVFEISRIIDSGLEKVIQLVNLQND